MYHYDTDLLRSHVDRATQAQTCPVSSIARIYCIIVRKSVLPKYIFHMVEILSRVSRVSPTAQRSCRLGDPSSSTSLLL